jgi:cytochrome c biogenesis protein CcdA
MEVEMIAIAPMLAASGLLSIADSIVRRLGSGDSGGLVHGLVLGVLRTPVAGPVLGSMTDQFENLARAGLLLVIAVGTVTLLMGAANMARKASGEIRLVRDAKELFPLRLRTNRAASANVNRQPRLGSHAMPSLDDLMT